MTQMCSSSRQPGIPIFQKRIHIYIVNLTTFYLGVEKQFNLTMKRTILQSSCFLFVHFMCEYFKNYSETMEKGTLWKAHLSHEILIDRMQLDRTYTSAMYKRTNKYFPFVCCWKTILSVETKGVEWVARWYEWYLKRNGKPLWNHKRRSVESQIEVLFCKVNIIH